MFRRPSATLLKWNAKRLELAGHITDTQTEDQTALREHVYAREFLRQDDRIPLGKQYDPGPELNLLRLAGGEREGRHGIHERRVRWHGRRRLLRID